MTIDVDVELREVAGRDVLSLKRALAEIWPDASRARIDEILPRHAERDGFRFLGAFSGRLLVGFVYGYNGAVGQWWHDCVAAALGPDDVERWLPPGHLEFTELHVRREYRRRGVGGALHDALLEGVDAPTAVLSTQTDNAPAIALYAGRGWQVIVPELDFGSGRPFVIMGKDL